MTRLNSVVRVVCRCLVQDLWGTHEMAAIEIPLLPELLPELLPRLAQAGCPGSVKPLSLATEIVPWRLKCIQQIFTSLCCKETMGLVVTFLTPCNKVWHKVSIDSIEHIRGHISPNTTITRIHMDPYGSIRIHKALYLNTLGNTE